MYLSGSSQDKNFEEGSQLLWREKFSKYNSIHTMYKSTSHHCGLNWHYNNKNTLLITDKLLTHKDRHEILYTYEQNGCIKLSNFTWRMSLVLMKCHCNSYSTQYERNHDGFLKYHLPLLADVNGVTQDDFCK